MTEDHSNNALPEATQAPSQAPTYLILALIAGIMTLSVVHEHLSPTEAQFLNRVIEQEASVDLPERLQSMWADFCGLMERPARLLGLWTAFAGLLILLKVIHQGRGSSLLAVSTVGAMGVFMSSAVNIGGSAPAFFALALVVLWVQKLTHLSLHRLAIGSIIVILGSQLALGNSSQTPFSWESLLSLGPDLSLFGLPIWLGCALTGLFLLGGMLAKRAFLGIFFMVGGLVTAPIAQKFGVSMAPTSWILASFGVPAALFLSHKDENEVQTPWLQPAALTLTLLVVGIAGYQAATAIEPNADRARLDWVASRLPQNTWLILDGDRNSVLRFYEHSGHRTGHKSILIRHQADRDTLVRVALSEKPPLICLLGTKRESIAGLLDRYEFVEHMDHPEGVEVLKFKRREN